MVEKAVCPDGEGAVGTEGAVGPIRVFFFARASTTDGSGILPDPESLCRVGRWVTPGAASGARLGASGACGFRWPAGLRLGFRFRLYWWQVSGSLRFRCWFGGSFNFDDRLLPLAAREPRQQVRHRRLLPPWPASRPRRSNSTEPTSLAWSVAESSPSVRYSRTCFAEYGPSCTPASRT